MFKRGAAAAPALAFEPGPMGPLVDTLVSRALEAVFGAGERVALEIFFHHALLALTLCLGIFIASKVVSPVLFGKTLAKLEPFERKIWHTNMVTFFPTFAVTYFAAPAIMEYTGVRYSFVHPATMTPSRAAACPSATCSGISWSSSPIPSVR